MKTFISLRGSTGHFCRISVQEGNGAEQQPNGFSVKVSAGGRGGGTTGTNGFESE